MTEALRNTGEDKRTLNHGGQGGPTDWQKTAVSLLRHQVLLLAMKAGRAPLPLSPALLRSLERQGFLNDIYDLGSIARRLLFVGDGRILLAELSKRGAVKPPAEENSAKQAEKSSADHAQFEDQQKWPLD